MLYIKLLVKQSRQLESGYFYSYFSNSCLKVHREVHRDIKREIQREIQRKIHREIQRWAGSFFLQAGNFRRDMLFGGSGSFSRRDNFLGGKMDGTRLMTKTKIKMETI